MKGAEQEWKNVNTSKVFSSTEIYSKQRNSNITLKIPSDGEILEYNRMVRQVHSNSLVK